MSLQVVPFVLYRFQQIGFTQTKREVGKEKYFHRWEHMLDYVKDRFDLTDVELSLFQQFHYNGGSLDLNPARGDRVKWEAIRWGEVACAAVYDYANLEWQVTGMETYFFSLAESVLPDELISAYLGKLNS